MLDMNFMVILLYVFFNSSYLSSRAIYAIHRATVSKYNDQKMVEETQIGVNSLWTKITLKICYTTTPGFTSQTDKISGECRMGKKH